MSEARVPPPSRLTGYGFGGGAGTDGSSSAPASEARPPSMLGGYGFGSVEVSEKEEPSEPRRKPRRRVGVIALLVLMAVSLVGGLLMIRQGSTETAPDAPLPAQPDYQAPADQQPVGADGLPPGMDPAAAAHPVPVDQAPAAEGQGPSDGSVVVENADTGGGEAGWSNPRATVPVTSMNVQRMEPMSVFVPEAKLYSLARPSESFVESKYEGLYSIQIPDNPRRSVWYSAAGAMADTNPDGTPALAGTTFLGSHSGYSGLWGAYLHMAYLQGGETIWTKDAAGRLQRWQVDRIRYMGHTSFPQEYWAADGPRRLVLTTCGGTAGPDGIYNQNVFVEAKPVELDGSPWTGDAPT